VRHPHSTGGLKQVGWILIRNMAKRMRSQKRFRHTGCENFFLMQLLHMHSAERDAIHIEQLELFARIGVTNDERERPQRLTVSITVWPNEQFDHLGDDVARAVDYSVVSAAVRDFVAGRSDKLIETLAEALASYLLGMFRIRQVQIELRKFALPDAQYAAAIVTRSTSVA